MNLYHDKQHGVLIYDRLPDPDRVLFHVRDAKRLSNGYVGVPDHLFNLQLLRRLDIPVVPYVTEVNYDWPIARGLEPKPHQRLMTNFAVLHPRCFNLSDMGTMKTLSMLWAADKLMKDNPGWKCLIVCPLSIMQDVWGDAIFAHFLGRRKYVIIHGDAKKREALLAEPADFYIINYEGVGVGATFNKKRHLTLGGLSLGISTRQDIAICIVDECTAYRAGGSRRSRVARGVLVPKPYVWCLTGTPTPNGPLDAHGIARLVNGAFGESFTAYQARVMYRVGPWKLLPRVGSNVEARKLLTPSIRFEMKDVIKDMPPTTVQRRHVELSDEQTKFYKQLKNDLVLTLKNGTKITAAHEAALRLKLIQISCGAIYDHDHNITRIDCAPRLAELRSVIEEAARKVIIFTPLTSVVQLLYDDLKEYSRAMFVGALTQKARHEIITSFCNKPDPQLLIADPGMAAEGLNLSVATVVVWYGATDRTLLRLQGDARIVRPEQKLPTTIVELFSTPVEREIHRRAASNTSMQGAILDLIK